LTASSGNCSRRPRDRTVQGPELAPCALTNKVVLMVRLSILVALVAVAIAATATAAPAHNVPKAKWLPTATIEFLFDRPVAISKVRAVSAPKCTGFGPSIAYKPHPSVRAFKHFHCKSLLMRKTATSYRRIGKAAFDLHLIATKQKFLLDPIKLTLD
jgi:hypothetical protein